MEGQAKPIDKKQVIKFSGYMTGEDAEAWAAAKSTVDKDGLIPMTDNAFLLYLLRIFTKNQNANGQATDFQKRELVSS